MYATTIFMKLIGNAIIRYNYLCYFTRKVFLREMDDNYSFTDICQFIEQIDLRIHNKDIPIFYCGLKIS